MRVVLWTIFWIIFVIMWIVVDGGLLGDERLLPASAWRLLRNAAVLFLVIVAFYLGMDYERHKNDEQHGIRIGDEDDEDGE